MYINNSNTVNKTHKTSSSTSRSGKKKNIITSISKNPHIICILDTQKYVLNHRKIRKLTSFLILMLFWIKEA